MARFDRSRHWKSKDGTIVPIEELDDFHLCNIILYLQGMLERADVAEDWRKSLKRSFDAMEAERVKRELPFPLVPYISLEYRQQEE